MKMENGEYGYEERTQVGPDESGAFYAAGTVGRVADHRMRCARTDISALRGYALVGDDLFHPVRSHFRTEFRMETGQENGEDQFRE